MYFSIQSEKLRQFGTFTTFEKIYRSFINNLKLDMTKRQVKAHLFYLANLHSFRYKPSPHVFCWYRVLSNFTRNIKTIATKHNKGNTAVWKQYSRNKTMKLEIFLQLSLGKLNENKFFNEMNIIDCILLVLFFLASMVLLKSTVFPLMIHFLNFRADFS